jgi:hypothetical protein
MTFSFAPARAAASRRNGAKSTGPKTPQGKARSARNALKHGLCAEEFVVLHDEDEQAFAALEASLLEELAPQGALQRFLAGRIVRAAWRLERAERIEIELLEYRMDRDGDLALALIRDGNGTRSIDTLMRYRGRAQAEFYRALRTLKEIKAEAKTIVAPAQPAAEALSPQQRDEPECRTNPEKIASVAMERDPGDRADASAAAPAGQERRPATAPQGHDRPNEPKGRANAGKPATSGPLDCGKAGALEARLD